MDIRLIKTSRKRHHILWLKQRMTTVKKMIDEWDIKSEESRNYFDGFENFDTTPETIFYSNYREKERIDALRQEYEYMNFLIQDLELMLD